jgi:tetratricopeptide (TPR) repeat protein
VALLFALGLMCKAMLVTLPLILLLLDYWPLKRLGTGTSVQWRVVVEKIPLLALSLGLGVAAMLGPRENAFVDIKPVPFWTRLGEAPVSLVIYLGQMFWPARLAVIYTHFEESLAWWPPALALLGCVSLGLFLWRGKHPYLWMGWLWNLAMLAPVSGIVQISRHARADHYNYLPQIGLYIGLTWLVCDWAGEWRNRRVALGCVAGAILLGLLAAAWRQTRYWRDDLTLWSHTLDCTRDNFIAHNQLGNALVDQGQTEQGIAEFREALRIDPNFEQAHYNLGNALRARGEADAGIAEYREALRINPAYPDAHNNLGIALFRKGEEEQGIAEFREALRINPNFAEAHYNLGAALMKLGQTEAAIAEFREALRINPGYDRARSILAKVLSGQGHGAAQGGE